MHDHDNNNNNGMKSMMWMMVVCCAVPLVLILLFGAGGRALGASSWIVFGVVGVMIIAHFFMMRRSHGHSHSDGEHGENSADKNKTTKDNGGHSGHGCCH